jgi:hypothetical protein
MVIGAASKERFERAAGRTADPSTSLRSGRDDKGRTVTFRKSGYSDDGVKSGYSATTADPSTSLLSGRDDKGRTVTFRKKGDSDGRSLRAATPRRLQIPPLRYSTVGMTRGEGWPRLHGLRDGEIASTLELSGSPFALNPAFERRNQAPVPLKTTPNVRARMVKSNQIDQFLMYLLSRFTYISKEGSWRASTCQSPVMPGTTSNLRR